jgi:hypothetical protein
LTASAANLKIPRLRRKTSPMGLVAKSKNYTQVNKEIPPKIKRSPISLCQT